MVVVGAVEVLHVQRQAGVLGKGLKPLLEQLGIHGAELVAVESHLPDQVGPVGGVERHAGQGLVHGNERLSVAPDALTLAERSEEHTSELQSLMRISYAVFCLKQTKQTY